MDHWGGVEGAEAQTLHAEQAAGGNSIKKPFPGNRLLTAQKVCREWKPCVKLRGGPTGCVQTHRRQEAHTARNMCAHNGNDEQTKGTYSVFYKIKLPPK